jgi:hypothetical protein
MYVRMKVTSTRASPAPPSLMAALTEGFDATVNRIALIAFPLSLDLLLWLGPHLRLKGLVDGFLGQLEAFSAASSPQTQEALAINQEVWELVGSRFNLTIALRTYPVGIPSLMASRLPLEKPFPFSSNGFEIPSLAYVFGIWALLSLIGLIFATVYFSAVASAAVSNVRLGSRAFYGWPWYSMQVILLTFLWAAIIAAISAPAFCVVSALTIANASIGRFSIMLYAGVLLWVLFPMLLSPHGIFVYRLNALASLRKSFRITRLTLPTTGMFFIVVIVLSQGLAILWKVPPENSWFTLIGLMGHAFITTGLLAGSFVYYREAESWIQKMTRWAQVPAISKKI